MHWTPIISATLTACLFCTCLDLSAQDTRPAQPKRKLLGSEPLYFIITGNRTFTGQEPENSKDTNSLPGAIRKFYDGKCPHHLVTTSTEWGTSSEDWAIKLAPRFTKASETKLPIVVLAQMPVELLLSQRGKQFVKDEQDQVNIKKGADGLQDFCARLQKMGADTILISDRGFGVRQPGSLQNWRAHDEFERRAISGVWRGPLLHELMAPHSHLFAGDGYHFSKAGIIAFHQAWFARLCQIDGIAVPQWCQDELDLAMKPPNKK